MQVTLQYRARSGSRQLLLPFDGILIKWLFSLADVPMQTLNGITALMIGCLNDSSAMAPAGRRDSAVSDIEAGSFVSYNTRFHVSYLYGILHTTTPC